MQWYEQKFSFFKSGGEGFIIITTIFILLLLVLLLLLLLLLLFTLFNLITLNYNTQTH